jgi:hypothetical protein
MTSLTAIPFTCGWTQHILKTICLAELMKEASELAGRAKMIVAHSSPQRLIF